jgi:endonuclease YncB( thermonuclease family)
MFALVELSRYRRAHCASLLCASLALSAALLVAVFVTPAHAAGCAFEPQGEGRVAAVTDARGFRLEDGREIRLAGIEPASSAAGGKDRAAAQKDRTAALAAIVAGREVTLRGQDDAPDRYGRQVAFVYLAGSETAVQNELLRQGLRRGALYGRGGGAAGQKGNLGRCFGHKKRGKSGRYFDRDRAVYGGRGQSSVRTAGRGNDLSQFWAELDTGLCCDYFKAHDAGG